MDRVHVVEVGPRDGFQSVGPFIPTATKIALVERLAQCGFTRMEIGSFVSPTVLPQMADVRAVLEVTTNFPTIKAAVLVPNLKGAELALSAGARNLVTVVSATESHNRSNTQRSIGASLGELQVVLGNAPRDSLVRYNIATSFHCPFEGGVAHSRVIAIIENALAVRADIEIGLCDTIGKATPREVAALCRICAQEFPDCTLAFHAHDTYGFGIANVLAAHDVGVRVFDSAAAGLGGCPFAPGASGNVATEDVVYAFERIGIDTGIGLESILSVADQVTKLPGANSGGHIRDALADATRTELAAAFCSAAPTPRMEERP